MLKDKLKTILILIILIIFTSGISVFATQYDGTEISVEEALNELFTNNYL